MEREKLVTSKKKKSPQGRPSRKYYEITEKGRRVMAEAKKILTDTLDIVFDKTSGP